MSENGKLCAVSKDFRETAEGDGLWRGIYEKRFLKEPRKSAEDTGQGGPGAGGSGCSGSNDSGARGGDCKTSATLCPEEKEGKTSPDMHGFKQRYNMRLRDPHVSIQGIRQTIPVPCEVDKS